MIMHPFHKMHEVNTHTRQLSHPTYFIAKIADRNSIKFGFSDSH